MMIPDMDLYMGEFGHRTQEEQEEKKRLREQNVQNAKDNFDNWRELLACCWLIKKIRNQGGYYYDSTITKEGVERVRQVFTTLNLGRAKFPFSSSLDDDVCAFFSYSSDFIDRAFYDDAVDEAKALGTVQPHIDFFEGVIKIWRYAASQMGPGASIVLDVNMLTSLSAHQFCPDIIEDVGKALRVDAYIDVLSQGIPVEDICRGEIRTEEM